MNDLKTVSALVKQILEDDVDARNSDNVLYLEVLRYYASKKGILIQKKSANELRNLENCWDTTRNNILKKSISVEVLYQKLRLVTEVPPLIYLLKLQSCLELHWTI